MLRYVMVKIVNLRLSPYFTPAITYRFSDLPAMT